MCKLQTVCKITQGPFRVQYGKIPLTWKCLHSRRDWQLSGMLVLMSNPGTDYWVLMSSPGTGLLSQLSVSLSSFFPPGFPGNLLLIIHKWRSKVWWLNWLFRLGPLLHTWCLLPGSVGGTRILFALVSIHHKFVFYPSQLFLNKVYQVNS